MCECVSVCVCECEVVCVLQGSHGADVDSGEARPDTPQGTLFGSAGPERQRGVRESTQV